MSFLPPVILCDWPSHGKKTWHSWHLYTDICTRTFPQCPRSASAEYVLKDKLHFHKKTETSSITEQLLTHCSNPKIRNKYSQKWDCAASVPSHTFMFLWAIYSFLFPRLVCLLYIFVFCCRKIGGTIVGIYKSLTETCRNWDWGRAVSFLRVHKSDFLCSAVLSHVPQLWAFVA
jgi:hypothetical protein